MGDDRQWGDLCQGDVIALKGIPHLGVEGPSLFATPAGVVILNQTCDVVQGSKTQITVAPILEAPTPEQISGARKGRLPLLLHLPEAGAYSELVADMSKASHVPKKVVEPLRLVSRHTSDQFGPSARRMSEQIGNVYTRFALPDEVTPVLRRFRNRVRSKALGNGNLGRVLGHLLDFRLSSTHWKGPGRTLTLYAIIPSELLPPAEDLDPSWAEQPVVGLPVDADLGLQSLDVVSGLLADSCDRNQSGQTSNLGELVLLWSAWCAVLQRELLDPNTNEEVIGFEVIPQGDNEMSVREWKSTVSMDLESLSGLET